MPSKEPIIYANELRSNGESNIPVEHFYWMRFASLIESIEMNAYMRGKVSDEVFENPNEEEEYNNILNQAYDLPETLKRLTEEMIKKQISYPNAW